MDVIFTPGAGLDVHKKSVMACRLVPDPTGKQADGLMEVREFGTLTIDLLALSDWLAAAGIRPGVPASRLRAMLQIRFAIDLGVWSGRGLSAMEISGDVDATAHHLWELDHLEHAVTEVVAPGREHQGTAAARIGTAANPADE